MLTHGCRSTLLGCFLGVALTGAAAAQSSRAATPPVEPGRTTHRSHDRPTPSVVAVARATLIQLDGRLDEPAWQSAEPATAPHRDPVRCMMMAAMAAAPRPSARMENAMADAPVR